MEVGYDLKSTTILLFANRHCTFLSNYRMNYFDDCFLTWKLFFLSLRVKAAYQNSSFH